MSSAAHDPFCIVREEIQESINKLQSTYQQWEQIPSNTGEHVHLTKELLTRCESIHWQVDELDKTIAVATREPSWYGIDKVELENRNRWTTTSRNQVSTLKKAIEAGKDMKNLSVSGLRQELMRPSSDHPYKSGRSDHYIALQNDDSISSETDQQMLLMKHQDEELDVLSENVGRIGGIGLTIHEELIGQGRILNNLNLETDSASNRLDFVQKKVSMVMKKTGVKGQLMMTVFLVILFMVLFVLVFFT